MYIVHVFICHLYACEFFASSRVHVKTLGENTAQKGGTALIRAAAEGRTECVRLLVDAGADTDTQDVVRVGLGVIMHLCAMGLFYRGFVLSAAGMSERAVALKFDTEFIFVAITV